MVDNFELIKKFVFSTLDEMNKNKKEEGDQDFNVIVGRVIRRKKENPDESAEYIVKEYVFKSSEELDKRVEEIKKLCELFNARFYINPTIKSLKDIALDMSEVMPTIIRHKNFGSLKNLFRSTTDRNNGVSQCRVWILDIDDKNYVDYCLSAYSGENSQYLVGVIPTINGAHLLLRPHKFVLDVEKDKADLKRNSLTVIYYKGKE